MPGDDSFPPVFFEIHSGLPREAPGDEASLARALSMTEGVPPRPRALDLGCGPGGQTVSLARRTGGFTAAMDNHEPFVRELRRRARAAGLADRIAPLVADMARPPFRAASFDLLWSEGAAYIIGVPQALALWRPLLRPRGTLALTEAVWLRPDAPEPVRRLWSAYPALTDVAANLRAIESAGYDVTGHFTLPDESWWTQYYDPMIPRLDALGRRYAGDEAALAVIEESRFEIDVRRRYPEYYGYEFFICRRTD